MKDHPETTFRPISLAARRNKIKVLEAANDAWATAYARMAANYTDLLDERETLLERIRQLEGRKHAEPPRRA